MGMSLFKKKEKAPELELVDEIMQEIYLALAVQRERNALLDIVKNAQKNGADCEGIQRVFIENLPIYRQRSDAVQPGIKEEYINGLRFLVPHRYNEFRGSDRHAQFTCNKFVYALHGEDGIEDISYLHIYVFNGIALDQAFSMLPIDKSLEIHPDITYGRYTGFAAYRITLLKNRKLEWFIYQREGRSVAINCSNAEDFHVYMKRIANG